MNAIGAIIKQLLGITTKTVIATAMFAVVFMMSGTTTQTADYVATATSVPEIWLMGNNPMVLPLNATYIEPGYGADDAEDGLLTDQVTVSGTVDTSSEGTYSLTYRVSDDDGNEATKTRSVVVVDNDAPVITLIGNNPMTLTQGDTFVEPGYSASDDEDGVLTPSVVRTGSVNTSVAGTYTLTYTITDSGDPIGAPKTTTVNRVVVVNATPVSSSCVGNTAPQITLMGNNPVVFTVGDTYVEAGYGADDAQDGLLTDQVVVTGTVDTSTAGTYILTYTVEDDCGAETSVTRVVTVNAVSSPSHCVGNTAPTLSLLGSNPLQLAVGDTFVEPGYSAEDTQDGLLTSQVVRTGTVNTSVAGTYILTYTVEDTCGAEVSVTRTVAVNTTPTPSSCVGNTAPQITLMGNNPVVLTVGDTYVEAGYGADDAQDGLLTDQVTVSGTVDTSTAGTYVLTYTVQDDCGVESSVTRTVTVNATPTPSSCTGNTAPIITLMGNNPVVLNIGDTYVEAGYGADDAQDGLLTDQVVVTGTVDTSTAGTYILTYTVEDDCGAETSVTRVVTVNAPGGLCVGNSIPQITLNGSDPMTVVQGTTFTDPGYTVSDANHSTSDLVVNVSGTVDTSVLSSFTLTYEVTDPCGDSNTITRTVTVVDGGSICPSNTTPVVTLMGDNPVRLDVGDTYVEPGYGADDAEDGLLTDRVVVTGTVDTSTAGTYTLQYRVEDDCGATTAVTRTVIVEAPSGPSCPATNVAPVVTLMGEATVRLNVGETYIEAGYGADDAEDGLLTDQVIVTGTVDTSTAGTYTLTYTVEDDCDVESSAIRTVIVEAPSSGGGGTGVGIRPTPTDDDDRRPSRDREPEPQVLGDAVCVYLMDYLRADFDNDFIEVMKLQAFLNAFEGFNLEINGVFDQETFEAVNIFQERYADEILNPWGYGDNEPTGYVYLLTKNKINEIFCNKTIGLSDSELQEIGAFRELLSHMKTENVKGAESTQPGSVSVTTQPKVGSPDDYEEVVGEEVSTQTSTTSTSTPITISDPDIDFGEGNKVESDSDERSALEQVAAATYTGLDSIVEPLSNILFSSWFLIILLIILLIWLGVEWYKGHNERKGQ